VDIKGISVVIPVFNSEATLKPLLARLKSTLETHTDSYEVIFVDDASCDNSWDITRELVASYDFVKGINLTRNFGQHNALLAGIRQAKYEITITIDDDLQHPPEEISKLLEKLSEGYDVVYGTPKMGQHGLLRNLASFITKMALSCVMSVHVARNTSAFRVFRTKLREAFADYHGPNSSVDVLLTWSTKKFESVEVEHVRREEGTSNYTFLKLLMHAINMATGFSTLPLRIATIIGFAFTVFGVAVFAYVVGRYMVSGTSVAGFPFLASIISIFSGVQLFALGVIGEYIGQIHSRALGWPSYQIRQTITNQADDKSAK
jgi:undecaprenyl-phosphate 4-deoxy-4-formamido-L-arabinose transferase